MNYPDVEDLPFGELRKEAFACGELIEKCKRKLTNPHTPLETLLKAMRDYPVLRDHMRRVTGAYMKQITLRN